MITLREHSSPNYSPRTYHNAAQGVTLAYAVDHTTAGERLTQKAAKGKIVMVDPGKQTVLEMSRKLYATLRHFDCHTLNVAGNGIYTFAKKGYTQSYVNDDLTQIINQVNIYWPIELIVSGGQSGADLGGLIAAGRCGIDAIGTWPKGYKMRFQDNKDVNMTPELIMGMIKSYA